MSGTLPAPLRRALVEIAHTPRLLVACDYDGVLAPIVANPDQAWPLPESIDALRRLAGLPETAGAVISGRALRDLAALSGLSAPVRLVGSHGAEFPTGFGSALDDRARELLRRLRAELAGLTDHEPGVHLEVKPASIAVHTRRAGPEVAARVQAAVRSGPCTWADVEVTEGKQVIELAVVHTDKGRALDVLRHEVGATAAVFVGDDVTDEKAFARLSGADLGIKVGPGETRAEHRVTDPAEVGLVLALLLEQRRTSSSG